MNRLAAAWRALTAPAPRRRDAYNAAAANRLLADWLFQGSAPDDILRGSMVRIRDRARDLERNTSIVKHFLRMCAVNVVGPDGMQCQPQHYAGEDLDDALNAALRDWWNEWSEQVTIDGRMDRISFEHLTLKTLARDGEAFVRQWPSFPNNRFGFALELIDPELVDETYNIVSSEGQNEVRLGVEVDRFGRPVAYHVWNRHVAGVHGQQRVRTRIPAEQIIHLYDPERVNQTRGVSWLAPVMVPIKMLSGYREAEVIAARISAAKMGFFERKSDQYGALSPDEEQNLDIEATPGSFLVLPDGYTATSWNADHPSTAYSAFIKDVMREIAVGLGVSYNSLNSDLEGVNYSSMRSGLLIERDHWRTLQRWWGARFLTPVYRSFVASALLRQASTGTATPRIPTTVVMATLPVRWAPRGWPWVDPDKDMKALALGIQFGVMSRTDACAEQGFVHERILQDLAREKALGAAYDLNIDGPEVAAAQPPEGGGDEDAERARTNGHSTQRVVADPPSRF